MWGMFGPLQFKTRGGGRVTLFAVWMVAPSLALLYFQGPLKTNDSQPISASDLRTGDERDDG